MSPRRISVATLALALLVAVLALTGSGTASAGVPATTARAAAAPRASSPPQTDYVIPPNSYFGFPNRSRSERLAIRNRVLQTIKSVWGGLRTPGGAARDGNGTIRIATWSFNDWDVARALVAARNRGVSVQLVAAKTANTDHPSWHWLRHQLGSRLYIPGHPETRDKVSFARECRGSCRGHGGTAHAKYFLFDNVGSAHVRDVVVQGSMNLTTMGFQGQWNQVNVVWSPTIYSQFMEIYRQSRIGRPVSPTYRTFTSGSITSAFFPLYNGTAAKDPVMQMLNRTQCTGSTADNTSGGRTRIRIIQYSVYGDRGTWLAKKLRRLWSRGCDIKMIYAVSSRPVISILRNGSGRGPIPLKQSVITNSKREIVKYNHSKWITISGNWGGATDSYVTMSGSANWSRFAFTGDEQFQTILSRAQALRHNNIFNITWRQSSSHPPMYATHSSEGRLMWTIPEQPTWGKGIYKYLSVDGD